MKPIIKTFILVTIFSIAMGFIETAVVVYLRALYYPAGFQFPIVPVSRLVLITELSRETATIIMLICIGIIAGKNFAQRFSFFIHSFAVWDITYYLFLKILLGWPVSLFTCDILFLIPVPWAGPVLAPCIISLSMIMFALIILNLEGKHYPVLFILPDWMIMTLAGIIFTGSFTVDYFKIIFTTAESVTTLQLSDRIMQCIPASYNWRMFAAAEMILLADFYLICKRSKKVI